MNNLFTNPNLNDVLPGILEEVKKEFIESHKLDVFDAINKEDKKDLGIENENRVRTEKLELTRKLATPKGEARFQHFNLMPGQVWVRKGSQEDKLTVEGIWHDLSTMTYLVKFKELDQVFDTHRSNLVSKLSGYEFLSGPDPEIDGTVIDGDLNRTTGSLAFRRSLKTQSEESIPEEKATVPEAEIQTELVGEMGKIRLAPGKRFDDGKKRLTVVSAEKIDPLNTRIAFEEIAVGRPETHSDIVWINMLSKLFGEKVFE